MTILTYKQSINIDQCKSLLLETGRRMNEFLLSEESFFVNLQNEFFDVNRTFSMFLLCQNFIMENRYNSITTQTPIINVCVIMEHNSSHRVTLCNKIDVLEFLVPGHIFSMYSYEKTFSIHPKTRYIRASFQFILNTGTESDFNFFQRLNSTPKKGPVTPFFYLSTKKLYIRESEIENLVDFEYFT